MFWSYGEAGCILCHLKRQGELTVRVDVTYWTKLCHLCSTGEALSETPCFGSRTKVWDPHCSANNLACLNRMLAMQDVLSLVGFPCGGEGNKLAGKCGHRLWSKIQCKLEAIGKTDLQRYCKVCFD